VKIQVNISALGRSRWNEYLVRFIFGGCVTAVAGIIASHYGPSVGGLFLAAPAIFPAAATLVEKHEEKNARVEAGKKRRAHEVAGVDAAGAAMGSIGLMAFAAAIWQLLPSHSTALVLAMATALWFLVSVVVWLARRKLYRSLRARLLRARLKKGSKAPDVALRATRPRH
jgi:hypothetical protein